MYTPGISERRSGVSKWSHQDYLGSTKALTNSSETVTDTRQYDAFGLQTGSTGSNPTPFGFAGGWGYQSDETGLQLLGHRYYDPSTGRFLTRDPVKDGRNWYGYCDNNPITSVDNFGLWSIATFLRGAASAIADSIFCNPIAGLKDWYEDMSRNSWNPFDAAAEKRSQFSQFAADVAHGDEGALGRLAGMIAAMVLTHKAIGLARASTALELNSTAYKPKIGSVGGATAGKPFSKSVRQAVLKANPDTCVYCGQRTARPEIDHVIPKSKGGNATLENGQTTCRHCNASKGARSAPLSKPKT